jgi:hypothetical protein
VRDVVAGSTRPAAGSVDALLAAAPVQRVSKAGGSAEAQDTTPPAAEPEASESDSRPEPVAQEEDEERPPPRKGARARAEDAEAGVLERAPSRLPPALLELSLGPRVMSRAFIYTDNVANLPGYTLPAAIGVSADVEMYPAARSKSAARNLGLAALWEASMGARTLGRDGDGSVTTRNNTYRVGARYRMQLSGSVLTLGGDYGQHRFDALIEDAIAPNVVYSLFRPSLGFKAAVGSGFSLGITAAYLHVLAVGDLGDKDRFPRLTAKGAEVAALLGYTLDRDFEVRLQADLRHYAHHMNVRPGDPLPVGGAVDEHFGASLLIRYLMR